MAASTVRAILFAKDLRRVAEFYATALDMTVVASDDAHTALDCRGFDLIVHQIPKHIADGIVLEQPPRRRVSGAIRLDYAVQSIEKVRKAARSLGGDIDDSSPVWAAGSPSFFLGYDPEGNQFGVSEDASLTSSRER